MRAVTLAVYDLRRIARHRVVWTALFAVPLACALARAIFAQSHAVLVCAWSCPVVCAALTSVVLYIQRSVDQISGLADGLRSTPLSSRELAASRLAAGTLLFAAQMALLGAILLIRF